MLTGINAGQSVEKLEALNALIEIVLDPKKAKAAVKSLKEASAEAEKKVAEAAQAEASLKVARDNLVVLEESLRARKAELEDEADELKLWDEQLNARHKNLTTAEAKAKDEADAQASDRKALDENIARSSAVLKENIQRRDVLHKLINQNREQERALAERERKLADADRSRKEAAREFAEKIGG